MIKIIISYPSFKNILCRIFFHKWKRISRDVSLGYMGDYSKCQRCKSRKFYTDNNGNTKIDYDWLSSKEN